MTDMSGHPRVGDGDSGVQDGSGPLRAASMPAVGMTRPCRARPRVNVRASRPVPSRHSPQTQRCPCGFYRPSHGAWAALVLHLSTVFKHKAYLKDIDHSPPLDINVHTAPQAATEGPWKAERRNRRTRSVPARQGGDRAEGPGRARHQSHPQKQSPVVREVPRSHL